jgi:hypothetical protein
MTWTSNSYRPVEKHRKSQFSISKKAVHEQRFDNAKYLKDEGTGQIIVRIHPSFLKEEDYTLLSEQLWTVSTGLFPETVGCFSDYTDQHTVHPSCTGQIEFGLGSDMGESYLLPSTLAPGVDHMTGKPNVPIPEFLSNIKYITRAICSVLRTNPYLDVSNYMDRNYPRSLRRRCLPDMSPFVSAGISVNANHTAHIMDDKGDSLWVTCAFHLHAFESTHSQLTYSNVGLLHSSRDIWGR